MVHSWGKEYVQPFNVKHEKLTGSCGVEVSKDLVKNKFLLAPDVSDVCIGCIGCLGC